MGARTIGLVGLGLVGCALATRLRAAGHRVIGYDIRAEARQAFAETGAEVADSLPVLGRQADCVLLAVFDTAGVLQVVEGADGLLGQEATVRTIVDCSTGVPELLEPLAARLQARGIGFLEAPLSGSSQQIEAGDATMLVGGDAGVLARERPLLATLAARVIHVGGAGMGARAKLATNLVLGLNRAVLAEGFAFAQRQGIAPAVFLELVLATPAASDAARVKGPQMVSGDFAPRSRVRQHLKDVELMLAAARAAGLQLPFSERHADLLREAVQAGDGDLDNAAIVRRFLDRPARAADNDA
jgi:3-hydroxyisobutyrate dehydrogenase-like beta-hydroxyacid dehydrogenase